MENELIILYENKLIINNVTKLIEYNSKNIKLEINKINYILKENEITYKEFDKDVIYEFTYEEGNYPKGLDNYIK